MENINKFTVLSETDAKEITGGLNINIDLGVSWGAVRDSIWGFTDGITGQSHKSKKQRYH